MCHVGGAYVSVCVCNVGCAYVSVCVHVGCAYVSVCVHVGCAYVSVCACGGCICKFVQGWLGMMKKCQRRGGVTRAEGRGSPRVRVVPALSVCSPLLPSAVAPVSFPRPPVGCGDDVV